MKDAARTIAISPRLELVFALAAALGDAGPHRTEGARRWLDQARRKLDQSFRRRLGDLADEPAFWQRLAALPLPRDAAISPDVEGVVEALAAVSAERFGPAPDPELRRRVVVDALRRFDRLAFAAYWRSWREELADDLPRLEASVRDLPIKAKAGTVIFLPSRFARPDFTAVVDREDTVLVPFDPDRLPLPSPPTALPRASAPTPRDPALIFRALGDATRYTIAGLIARAPLTSAELARRLDISKPTMAHHLRALRAAGLVVETIQGRRIALTLDRSALENLSAATVAQLFGVAADAPIRRSRRAG